MHQAVSSSRQLSRLLLSASPQLSDSCCPPAVSSSRQLSRLVLSASRQLSRLMLSTSRQLSRLVLSASRQLPDPVHPAVSSPTQSCQPAVRLPLSEVSWRMEFQLKTSRKPIVVHGGRYTSNYVRKIMDYHIELKNLLQANFLVNSAVLVHYRSHTPERAHPSWA